MKRIWTLLAFGGAGLLLTPAAASAQFVRPLSPLPGLQSLPSLPSLPPIPGLQPLPGLPTLPGLSSLPGLPAMQSLPSLPSLPTLRGFGGAPVLVPSMNPFYYAPVYGYTRGYGITVPSMFGSTTLGFRETHYGINPPIYLAPGPIYSYGQTGSYITGSPGVNGDAWLAAQRNVAAAQRLAGAKGAIVGAWDYEKGNKPAPEAVAVQAPAPAPAAAPEVPAAALTSADALNAVLKDILAAEAKGAKGPSGYVPPLLLEDVRFAHTPAGDLLNLARQAGALKFPAAFDAPALAGLRTELEKQFAAAAVPVQAGRAPDPDKVTRLEVTLNKLQDAAGPIIKDLPFEEAIPARQFLNQMAGAVKAMKGTASAGLIDPKWSTEGVTVADLVRHMAKYKLQFGPAPRAAEGAYATLYRDLATYLMVLQQPKK